MARILVVDDEEVVRTTVRLTLEYDGHTVEEANDGAEALVKFGEIHPEIVITDILMPNMEGIETIVALRKMDKNVKIVAMSGGGLIRNMEFLEVAEKLGANSVLKKPFGATAIQEMVTNLLSERSWSTAD